jgi:rhamnose transport system permease protein
MGVAAAARCTASQPVNQASGIRAGTQPPSDGSWAPRPGSAGSRTQSGPASTRQRSSIRLTERRPTVGQLPGWILSLATAVWGSVPAAVWLSVLVVILVGVVLQFTPWGRRVYAYGSNPEAARYFGLDSRTIVTGAYVGAGVIAALAGLLLGAQVGNINSLLANGIELQVLAAVVVGGVSIWGGSGSVFGAAIGAIVLATINNGLVLLGINEYYRLLFQGLAIVLAVGVDAIVQNRVRTATRRRRILEVGA